MCYVILPISDQIPIYDNICFLFCFGWNFLIGPFLCFSSYEWIVYYIRLYYTQSLTQTRTDAQAHRHTRTHLNTHTHTTGWPPYGCYDLLNCFNFSGDTSNMTFEDFTSILGKDDLKQICKELKLKNVDNKQDAIAALASFSKRSSNISNFLTGCTSNNSNRVLQMWVPLKLSNSSMYLT